MSAVATAIVGTTIATGYIGSKAADKAAKTSEKGTDKASQVQWDMYDQTRKDQAPWLGTGANALRKLAALSGVDYSTSAAPGGQISRENFDSEAYLQAHPELSDPKVWWQGTTKAGQLRDLYTHWTESGSDPTRFKYINAPGTATAGGGSIAPDYSAFYDSPDYKFTFGEGQRAVNAGLAARGLSNSGRAMKELTRYGQGAASTQLNNYRRQLAEMAGIGSQTATNLGNTGANTANQVGSNTQNAADARASGYLGSANSWNSAINSGASLGAYGKTNKWWG